MFAGISQENMAWNMVLTYLHVLDPEILVDNVMIQSQLLV